MPSASVDLAYSLLTLQHVEKEDAFLLLEQLRRVLRPGGTLAVTCPNLLHEIYLQSFLHYAHNGGSTYPTRARGYTPDEVRLLMRAAGFKARIESSHEIRVFAKPVPEEDRVLRPVIRAELSFDRKAAEQRLRWLKDKLRRRIGAIIG